ncbi:MAG: FAD binding domain-containing protein [Myxococcota bacterium]|nr:FAD binding domain-containing protein [Myxococcota bacterium]
MGVEFILNERHIETEESAGMLALDWLRLRQNLTGTKEGCKEGDCGACSVMIGELDESGKVRYKPVTSCLTPLGELHGKHLLTIEGLNLAQGTLNPVQQAMVDRGGSQCGYCTPGFIVSMCWYMMQSGHAQPTEQGLKDATSGNLCRCTGYGSIRRASQDMVSKFSSGGDLADVWSSEDRVGALVEHGLLPEYLSGVAARLSQIEPLPRSEKSSPEFIIAGGTDLYVQRGEEIPRTDEVEVLGLRGDMAYITLDDTRVMVGGLTTFEDFAQNPEIQAMLPTIEQDMQLIASLPIRNRASIAGNLINASPIGDMTALMMALGAKVVLQKLDGNVKRELPLEDLYLGYKTLAKEKHEIVAELVFDRIDTASEHVSFEKVSKRRWLDIATVNSAARIKLAADGTIASVRLALGGVAATPLYLKETSAWLVGKQIDASTMHGMVERAMKEIAPISDVRGSARYKSLLARQLLLAHFDTLFPARAGIDAVLGAHLAATEVSP